MTFKFLPHLVRLDTRDLPSGNPVDPILPVPLPLDTTALAAVNTPTLGSTASSPPPALDASGNPLATPPSPEPTPTVPPSDANGIDPGPLEPPIDPALADPPAQPVRPTAATLKWSDFKKLTERPNGRDDEVAWVKYDSWIRVPYSSVITKRDMQGQRI